jgi:hypothetical protein
MMLAMRCPTCGNTLHPGYVACRDTDIGSGLVRRSLVPCPDCGGSGVATAADGAVSAAREIILSADQVIEVAPEPGGAAPA